jgi:TRAP-type C4-dicarboxylate transport system permease small subunit
MNILLYLVIAVVIINTLYIGASYISEKYPKKDKWSNATDWSILKPVAIVAGAMWPVGVPVVIAGLIIFLNVYFTQKVLVPYVLKKLGVE